LGECQSDDGMGIITLGRCSYKGQAFQPRRRVNLLEDSDSSRAQKKPPWTYLTNISPSHHWLWLIRDNPLGFPFLCCKASHLGDCTSSLSLLLDKVKHFSKLFYKNLQLKTIILLHPSF
jgi:hypothetical protein